LLFKRFRVIDVMTAQSAEQRRSQMTFTIDAHNNITAHDSPEAAAAATEIPFESFSTQKELAKIAADWPTSRFVEIWNAMAGAPPFGKLKPVKKFTDRVSAITRLWNVIHILSGDAGKDIAALEAYVATKKAAQDAPEAAAATKETSGASNAPKAKRGANRAAPKKEASSKKHAKPATAKKAKFPGKKASKPAAEARDGSKKAAVLDMMRRAKGATLKEIIAATDWQPHTCRAFISIAGKKLGLKIESSKNEAGDRTYKL
jgi:hypothetical protein